MTERTGAVRVHPAWDDPAAVLDLIRGAGPYLPLARYAASDAQRKATGGGGGGFVPPWFRLDVAALGEVLVPGGDHLLRNQRFVDAARAVFGAGVVVDPTTLYVNVMGPCGYPFVAHTDIPVFRGRNAKNTPPWLLHQMHASGLFADERIAMATAVSWFYDGPGGDFWYWPDGPDGEPSVEQAPFDNVAIVADNEHTPHGVGPVGETGAPSPTDLTLDAELRHGADGWVVDDGGREIHYDDRVVRVTTSWKAEVFADEAARDLVRSGRSDLEIGEVVARFGAAVGVEPRTADPLADDEWIETVTAAYAKPKVRIPQV